MRLKEIKAYIFFQGAMFYVDISWYNVIYQSFAHYFECTNASVFDIENIISTYISISWEYF